jgi:hypothetical protein
MSAGAGRATAESVLEAYFRLPGGATRVATEGSLSPDAGYFRFGAATLFGRCSGESPATYARGDLPTLSAAAGAPDSPVRLPFDLAEVAANLRHERYRQKSHRYLERATRTRGIRAAYYALRPLLPVGVRKHLQRIRLRGWDRIEFPRWPVDCSVDALMQDTMALIMRSEGIRRMPFIWFWPDGAESCVMMTHDVESRAGRAFCDALMDLDDSVRIKAAFQVIPEAHCERSTGLMARLRDRGFEVNLHDFNHDGSLYRDRQEFLRRAARINRYARELECSGFRSGAMYRVQDWYDAFAFSYDMSVPNAAHLEPQRGGCCTVMPYFIGDILELPLTTTQDYSLFHILGDYSTALWERQIAEIRAQHGLISFIAHPDYLIDPRARAVYEQLLACLCRLRDEGSVWFALPGEIDSWWRSRQTMSLIADGDGWRIEGDGSERARLAYAALDGERLTYELA